MVVDGACDRRGQRLRQICAHVESSFDASWCMTIRDPYDSDVLLLIRYRLRRLNRKEEETMQRWVQILAHEIAAFSGA